MKFRLVVLTVLLLLDLFLAPLALKFPPYAKKYGFKFGFEKWRTAAIHNPVAGPGILLKDSKIRHAWLWLQPAVGALALTILFPSNGLRRRRKETDLGGPEAAGSGQFGTARWRTEKEVDKTTIVWDTKTQLQKGGFVLGADFQKKRKKVWLETQDTHVLLVGATRSGKSRRVILPTIWTLAKAGESMVVTDPKGELYERTVKYLAKQGYDVVLLNFRNPRRGNKWNPMTPVVAAVKAGDEALASELAWDIAHTIVYQQPHSGDPIWPAGEESVIAALILAVAAEAERDEQKHMASVYALLTRLGRATDEGIIPLNVYLNDCLADSHLAKAAFGTAAISPSKMRASFFGSAATDLRLWADPSIAFMTAFQDHDLAGPGVRKTAVFLVIPDETSTRHVLAALYISQIYQALTKLASLSGGRLPVRVNFLLDEFGNLPPISDFDKKITVAAGRNMRFLLAVQDLAQVKKHYKENAQTITGNCHTWIYLATADVETAKVISAKTGQYTVQTESYSSSLRTHDYSSSTSQGLTGRALLLPDEVLRWPLDQALVLQIRQFPARLPLPDLSSWPADKELQPMSAEEKPKGGVVFPSVWVPEVFTLATESATTEQELEQENIFDKM